MLVVRAFPFLFVLGYAVVSTDGYCEDTTFLLSKCDPAGDSQWLIEVPRTASACKGEKISPPQSVSCNFGCAKGATFDRDTLDCRKCSAGSFSLGGGLQYTFASDEDPFKQYSELTLKGSPLLTYSSANCKTKDVWKVKGNVLQGDVQPNCAISLTLTFKMVQAGSVTINYNLATSYVFGTISSRCDFTLSENDDDEDELESTREQEFHLRPTGYGAWKDKKIEIKNPGDYKLQLFTLGINAFHFPFSVRSIAVEGTTRLQDCIPCPKGTYTSEMGSGTCTPCPRDTFAAEEGSVECVKCPQDQYAEEGSEQCLPRPKCEAKHYRKVFIGCDTSDKARIDYVPVQPQICTGGARPTSTEELPCATCNPGMYKKKQSEPCEFCPAKTFSNGTTAACLPCANELSLLPGLYYHNWNGLPKYIERSYLVFDNSDALKTLNQNQSWTPSIDYISSQAVPDALSVLSLSIVKGFRSTDIAKLEKEYGTLYFKFSVQCQADCSLFLVSQDVFLGMKDASGEDKNWEVLHKWKISGSVDHKNITDYTYSIQYSDPVVFNWLFTSDVSEENEAEIRIYEIRVSNTVVGGSDRCTSCLTVNNQETECKACAPGHILSNNTCIPCPPSSIASRIRAHDLVPVVCKPCPNNTISDDGISCYIPCTQSFNGPVQYDLTKISRIDFHGSKLFTQKGSGYFHVFNASICGKTSVTCKKTSNESSTKRSSQFTIESKLCRMGSIPDKDANSTSVAYIDDFGEQLSNVSLVTLKYFPPLRSDYNLTDITLVYSANTSGSQSFCPERITYLSLRCDHILEEDKPNSTLKSLLQTPTNCATGTCDGCTFYFLLRTPLACPICDENTNGYRTFLGPCKFGRQEVRKIPLPYCAHEFSEKVETRRCSNLSTQIQILLALLLLIAGVLISLVIFCWRKNRKLEYRYMQLIENNNPDDDAPVDNVCAQLSDEDESDEEVQFRAHSKTKKIMNVVRKAIGKGSANGRSDVFKGDSFLLTSSETNDA